MSRSRWAARARRQGRLAARLAVVVPLGMLGVSALVGTAAALPSGCTLTGSTVTCTFSYTGGAQTFTVPTGVQSVTVTADGAAGGESGGASFAHAAGGLGAQVKGTLAVTPGAVLQVNVGGQGGADGRETGGFNGGGCGGGGCAEVGNDFDIAGGGGGASDIRVGSDTLADRLLVAAGGGGGGGYGEGTGSGGSGGVTGGAGGGSSGSSSPNGQAGKSATGTAGALTLNAAGGGGGSVPTGGSGGSGDFAGDNGVGGSNGSLGSGGGGGRGGSVVQGGEGGGGGGGSTGGGGGGGGGANSEADNPDGAGGGGGAAGQSLVGPSLSHATVTPGVQSGNGLVTISYTADADLAVTQPANITVDATGPSGATVTYQPPAVTDPDDASPPAAVCTPKSGSVFAIGTTTVTCTATDTDDINSPVSASFTVAVKGAAAQLADLYQAALNTRGAKGLARTIAQAEHQAAGKHPLLACQTLNLFILEVELETPWRIPASTAAQLIADAKQIQAVLGCSRHRFYFPFGF